MVGQAVGVVYSVYVITVDLSLGSLICDQSHTDGTHDFEICSLSRLPKWLRTAQGTRRFFHPLESRRGSGPSLYKAHRQWKDDYPVE
jgi:hypothetical protein